MSVEVGSLTLFFDFVRARCHCGKAISSQFQSSATDSRRGCHCSRCSRTASASARMWHGGPGQMLHRARHDLRHRRGQGSNALDTSFVGNWMQHTRAPSLRGQWRREISSTR